MISCASFGGGDRFQLSLIASMVGPTGSSYGQIEHKIHHDHRHFWITRFFDQATDAVGGVNHWMRLAVGEVVIAKVEEGVFDAAVDILQAIQDRAECCRHRHVFPSPRTWFRRTAYRH